MTWKEYVHIFLVILGVVYFLWQFIKDRELYQLLFVIWIPTTLLTYIIKEQKFIIALSIFQIASFILVIFLLFRKSPKKLDDETERLVEIFDNPNLEETTDEDAEQDDKQEKDYDLIDTESTTENIENNSEQD